MSGERNDGEKFFLRFLYVKKSKTINTWLYINIEIMLDSFSSVRKYDEE